MTTQPPEPAAETRSLADRLHAVIRHRSWAIIGGVLGGVAAIATIFAAALPLVHSNRSSCGHVKRAELSAPAVHRTTLGSFLAKYVSESSDLSQDAPSDQLKRSVNYITVNLRAVGYRDRTLRLSWGMLDASNPDATDLPANKDAVNPPIDTCDYSDVEYILVDPPVPKDRTVYFTLSLFAKEGDSWVEVAPEVTTTDAVRGRD